MSLSEHFAARVEETSDFPVEGVLFRSILPALEEKGGVKELSEALLGRFTAEELAEVDAFVGLDARGYIFAAPMSVLTEEDKGFIAVRKAGKLPPPVVREEYELEYGTATIEMKPGNGKVIIVDDLLATGGTLKAAANLCTKAGYEVTGFAVAIDLTHLNDFEWGGMTCRALISYDELGYIPEGQKPSTLDP